MPPRNADPSVFLRTCDRPDLLDGALDDAQKKQFESIKTQAVVIAHIPHRDVGGPPRFLSGFFYQNVRNNLPEELPTLLARPPAAYQVRGCSGKGRGLFSTRDIQAGEVIVVERPLVIAPSLIVKTGMSLEAIWLYLLDYLSPEDRAVFLSLANSKGGRMIPPLGIFATNAVGLDLKGGEESYGAVFPLISRANHSCGPNATWRFDYATFSMCLHAGRDIPSSTEITATYCSLEMSRSQRLYELNRKYHFTCTCPHCIRPSSESDSRRKELDSWRKLHLTYEQWIVYPKRDPDALIRSSLKALVMIAQEGIETVYAYRHYGDLAKSYGALGEERKMREWGWKFILAYKSQDGRDENTLADWVEWLMDPPCCFPDWGRALS